MPVNPIVFAVAAVVLVASPRVEGGELQVLSVSPAMNALNAATGTSISVTFDQALMRNSVTSSSFWAFGRWSGAAEGTFAFSNGDQTVTLTPDEPFSAGEWVMVIVSHDVQALDGSPLRQAGYSWQFITRARPSNLSFGQIDSLSTEAFPGEFVRSYGGIASDLNNDGWLDLTIVNEDTMDLRVFVHGGGSVDPYATFLQPTFEVGDRASPSEPSDFNRDGFTDICVANIDVNTVSVLLGNGDGTYGTQQEIIVGLAPRGIAVLDADGDGDIDIANTNSGGSNNVCVMLNDGNGVFGPPSFFEGGGAGEWALAAGDMNEDGILDLVVGARTAQLILVDRGNGDGTFTPIATQLAGGQTWMINVADLNGDGHNDVVSANSSNNNASRLLGTGTGSLGPPQAVVTDAFPLGSDLGDLDGDGDLDWVTSSFQGDWRLYLNNSAGAFTFSQEFNAPSAASCALLYDLDNDRDLDLGLVDELADLVILYRNNGIGIEGDVNADGVVDVNDLVTIINTWGACPLGQPCAGDINGDDIVDIDDLLAIISNWS